MTLLVVICSVNWLQVMTKELGHLICCDVEVESDVACAQLYTSSSMLLVEQ